MADDSENNQATLPSSLTAGYKSKNDRKNETSVQNCWYYINGNCRYGDKCHKSHDPFMRKAFQNASLKLSADGTVTDKKIENDVEPQGRSLVSILKDQVFYE